MLQTLFLVIMIIMEWMFMLYKIVLHNLGITNKKISIKKIIYFITVTKNEVTNDI